MEVIIKGKVESSLEELRSLQGFLGNNCGYWTQIRKNNVMYFRSHFPLIH